nr:integrase, catalytic region, zinc finger, CCHC-type, peptidase aspartic, catalytic [Tanacetum cinerariifolium]
MKSLKEKVEDRKKINAKMTDPECVTHKVKIAPHDYSKENLLATFTPQKQLTPEQIYWSNDLMKLKSEALKERAKYWKSPPSPDKDTPDFDSVFVIGKMQSSLQGKDNVIRQLKKQISQLQVTNSDTECTIKVRTTDSQLTKVTDSVTNLQAQTDCLRAENDKVKQHYKQLYDSIKITHAKHIEQATKLTAENVTLKTSVSKAKELLEYATGTCPPGSQPRAKQLAYTPFIRKKQVTAIKPSDRLNSNKNKHVVTQKIQKTNVPVPHSTGVKHCLKASGSQPKSNHKTNRISPAKGAKKLPVEDLPRTNKSYPRTTNRVDLSSRLKRS